MLAAAVALAFADSSIVVLAAPDLLSRFETSIQSVSFVITAYNAVVAVGVLAFAAAARRFGPRWGVRAGLAVFAVGSILCALAPGLGWLIGARCVQALGAALLLAGALPLLGVRAWAVTGALGAALGPALGGFLTQAFDWRAIFVAQVPVALLAAFVLAGVRVRPAGGGSDEQSPLRRVGANVALALVSGALAGALFLVVVLLVEGWGLSPLAAAAAVSTLPLATLAAWPLAARLGVVRAAGLGALLLAAGLAALALLPGDGIGWVAAALTLCGAGLGLAVPPLTRAALPGEASPGAWSTSARHAGLVLGLVLLTPVLADDLARAADRAKVAGAEVVLDAPIGASEKVPLALDLAGSLADASSGRLPDLAPAFERAQERAGSGGDVVELRRSLEETIRAVVTRSFRGAFALAAGLALLSLLPLVLLRRGRLPPASGRRARAALATVVAALALPGAEIASGALGYGAPAERDACDPPASPPGGRVERTAWRGVDEAACALGTSRERLVLRVGTDNEVVRRIGALLP